VEMQEDGCSACDRRIGCCDIASEPRLAGGGGSVVVLQEEYEYRHQGVFREALSGQG